jgi:hypothetical protein
VIADLEARAAGFERQADARDQTSESR